MAQYPSAAGTDANLFVAVNNLSAVLNGAINAAVTTITVLSTTGFPTAGYITIDSEAISYTGTTGTTFTGCTRGADGTTAATHVDASQVLHTVIAAHHNTLKDEVKAVEGDLVGTMASITPVTAANTATSLLQRLAHIVSQIKNMTGLTNWYDAFTSFPIAKGGTNSTAALSNNRVMKSSGGAIVEATAITANRAITSDSNGIPVHATTTDTEIGYVNGVTSAIQTQINTKAADTAVVHNTGTESVAGAKTFTTQLIGKGTATNDSAAAGYIGEYIESVVSAVNYPTSTQYGDATSIALTAGDWDVSADAEIDVNGTTFTELNLGISVTTGNSSTGLTTGSNTSRLLYSANPATLQRTQMTVPVYRLSLSGSATVYLKYKATYSSSPQIYARLSARRVR